MKEIVNSMNSTRPIPPNASSSRRHESDDLEILALADENHYLRERVTSLEDDNASYRELTCAAFDALHDLTRDHDRLRAQHHHLRDEYRALRERILIQAGADDPNGIAA
jgi:hypothetical protein